MLDASISVLKHYFPSPMFRLQWEAIATRLEANADRLEAIANSSNHSEAFNDLSFDIGPHLPALQAPPSRQCPGGLDWRACARLARSVVVGKDSVNGTIGTTS